MQKAFQIIAFFLSARIVPVEAAKWLCHWLYQELLCNIGIKGVHKFSAKKSSTEIKRTSHTH